MSDDKRSEEQAKAQLRCIHALVAQLDTEDEELREAVQTEIWEEPLEVAVRSDWHAPSDTGTRAEYLILLSSGGPAVRIIGELGLDAQPESARLEHQDWFIPWTVLPLEDDDKTALLTYAQQFYYDAE